MSPLSLWMAKTLRGSDMKYVGLCFHGITQSWGGPSSASPNADSPRNTEASPTLSGVLGLVRSALGVKRGDSDNLDLRNLRMLVRVDRSGSLLREYQVAQRNHHGFAAGPTVVTPKMYLQDATFIVMLGHPDANIVDRIAAAFRSPEWAPFLGRRCNVPSLPIFLGTVDTEDPRYFLGKEVPIFWGSESISSKSVRTFDSAIDQPHHYPILHDVTDFPHTFNPKDRSYGIRQAQTYSVTYSRDQANSVNTVEQYKEITSAFQGAH